MLLELQKDGRRERETNRGVLKKDERDRGEQREGM